MEPLILVIDDDEKTRELLAEILMSFQYRVVPAETSEEGLELAIAHQPDVVLCDVMLPDALGFETVKALNAHPLTCEMPVVLMTGYPYMRKFEESGKYPILTKPFTMSSVVEAVKVALGKSSSPSPGA